ncbi:DUF4249 domain-containing protein [Mucilaginibacter terrae]|uniref:DUF4249 domain-containing protein n=1 Tax=Mucilaginibacter terrae TaxID=1955052 RepID=UPI00363692CE
MKKFKIYITFLMAAMFMVNCKEVYSPPEVNVNTNWLVVEGIINTGADSTIFKLSRTVKLTSASTLKPELKAIVTVESNANNIYTLTEKGGGVYFALPLGLDPAKQYRVRIKTTDNKQYLSDFVETKLTPAIDDITFKADDSNLKIYNSTHDDSNKARYYKFDYTETYEFHSPIPTYLKSDGKDIVPRVGAAENITICWRTIESTSVGLASTVKLTKDVVNDNLLTTIPSASERVSVMYSVLLKQYALTKDAFEFWQTLKKNTEQVGSIFDAQPSALKSNIHPVNNSTEVVIGYISACNVTTKRIFISTAQLPAIYSKSRLICAPDTFRFVNPVTKVNEVSTFLIPKLAIPSFELTNPFTGTLIGYLGSSGNCIDCTLRGSNRKPSFWP